MLFRKTTKAFPQFSAYRENLAEQTNKRTNPYFQQITIIEVLVSNAQKKEGNSINILYVFIIYIIIYIINKANLTPHVLPFNFTICSFVRFVRSPDKTGSMEVVTRNYQFVLKKIIFPSKESTS